MTTKRFRVAICGGGVGGLTCALALSRYHDIQVDVYESAAAFTEIGAGIGLWPRSWKILCALGLADDLTKVAMVPPTEQPRVAFTLRKGDQPEGASFYTLSTPGGLLAFHRPDFHGVVLRHLSSQCRTHTGKRLVSYSHTSSPQPATKLYFRDGTTATCDVLIGADGVKSAVRSALVRELAGIVRAEGKVEEAQRLLAAGAPKWSGTVAYRALIPAEILRQRAPQHQVLNRPMLYLGENSELTVYPIARGTFINFAAFRSRYDLEGSSFDRPWVQDVSQEEVLADFDGWEPEVHALVQSLQKVNRWAIHTTSPLPTFVSGRVALLGDAAHAMMPYQGAGAGQSIEDAYVLATLLGDARTTLATIDRALCAYDAVRRPFAQRVQEASRENGLLYTLNFPGLTFDRPARRSDDEASAKLDEISSRIVTNWQWAWNTTIDGDLNRALRMLDGPMIRKRWS
ncbi:FAD/NAD(P)-binding domain-containing protein [Dichomitus squalens]|uniref:FAD/NAD(P)-binding domain-containing protein n=1 Tax=Dichomitus squalens TaxID=114155 RepID=A0A4V2K7W1_9APHY|nr:FAD/NAD(P)-binding domain-containing protein [Dichomitus squalens]